ncbi:MAG: head-tail connector protein [Dehalococcoidales bacterium]|nr:head-tail connector protein [Dehalococcoidales bacterium]
MPVSETLLDKVKNYVRAGDEDDLLLVSLISAAKQYLSNAGVEEPPAPEEPEDYDEHEEYVLPEEDGELSLYELAVVLYVNLIYNGGKETLLDQAMTGIILQIKNYNGV